MRLNEGMRALIEQWQAEKSSKIPRLDYFWPICAAFFISKCGERSFLAQESYDLQPRKCDQRFIANVHTKWQESSSKNLSVYHWLQEKDVFVPNTRLSEERI